MDQKQNHDELAEWFILHQLFHDTKNPLQVISSALNMLESNIPQSEREKLYVIIRENSAKINDSINQLVIDYHRRHAEDEERSYAPVSREQGRD